MGEKTLTKENITYFKNYLQYLYDKTDCECNWLWRVLPAFLVVKFSILC